MINIFSHGTRPRVTSLLRPFRSGEALPTKKVGPKNRTQQRCPWSCSVKNLWHRCHLPSPGPASNKIHLPPFFSVWFFCGRKNRYSEFILFYELGTSESTFTASLFHRNHSYLALLPAMLGVTPKHTLSLLLGITPIAHCGRSKG